MFKTIFLAVSRCFPGNFSLFSRLRREISRLRGRTSYYFITYLYCCYYLCYSNIFRACRGFVVFASRKIFAGFPGIGEPDKYLGEYFIITTSAGRAAPGF